MVDTEQTTSSDLQRPNDILEAPDGIGVRAWQAFNAMEATKRRHFEYLEILDEKKKNYNIDPTASDKQRLACLLMDHDDQVKRFTEESRALKSADSAAHTALFLYIGLISDPMQNPAMTH
ncbi:MAG: hypothetical protein KTR32_28900 [Granulosicoccus sp.]|nr:hypothetical protein [Granulosicoccus sp.]